MEFHYLDKRYSAKFNQEDEKYLADQLSINIRKDQDLLLTLIQVLAMVKVDHSLINVMRKEGYIAKDAEYIDLMNHVMTTTDIWGLLFSQGLAFSKEHLTSWAIFIIRDDTKKNKPEKMKTDSDEKPTEEEKVEEITPKQLEIMNLFTFLRGYIESKDTDKILMNINHSIQLNNNLEVTVKFKNRLPIITHNNELFSNSVFVQENREFVDDTQILFDFYIDVSDSVFKYLEILFSPEFRKLYITKELKEVLVQTKKKGKKEMIKKIVSVLTDKGEESLKDFTKDDMFNIIRICHEMDLKILIAVLCDYTIKTHKTTFDKIKQEIKKVNVQIKIVPY